MQHQGDGRQVLAEFQPGRTVYVPGSVGEPLVLRELLAAEPDRARGVHFLSCFLPGQNDFDYAALHAEARATTFLFPPAFRASFEAGRVRVMPLAYSQIADHLAHRAEIDVAIQHVSAPDADGLCSLGLSADFTPLVWRRAKRRVAIVNPSLPAPPGAPRLPLAEMDAVVELDSAVVTVEDAKPSAEVLTIARRVAELIPDRAAIQTGLGGAPGAIFETLTGHRGLTIRSGMITPGFRLLAQAGALAADGHVTGVAVGPADFHAYVAEAAGLTFADASVTHGPASLAAIERFFSINSALEVDLFGQVNLEWRGERMISGVGGAPDFIRAGWRCPGGMSIIALPATAGKDGATSRIVPRLLSPTVSIGRNEVDAVVTEFGVARLADRSLDERAEALIAIAHPGRQAELAQAWSTMRARL